MLYCQPPGSPGSHDLVLLVRPTLERDDVSLTSRGQQLRHGDDGEAHEGVRLADLLTLVPDLEEDLTAPARDLTEITVRTVGRGPRLTWRRCRSTRTEPRYRSCSGASGRGRPPPSPRTAPGTDLTQGWVFSQSREGVVISIHLLDNYFCQEALIKVVNRSHLFATFFLYQSPLD